MLRLRSDKLKAIKREVAARGDELTIFHPDTVELFLREPSVSLLTQPGLVVCGVSLPNDVKPFDDVRVRRALNLAVDKAAINQSLVYAQSHPSEARAVLSSYIKLAPGLADQVLVPYWKTDLEPALIQKTADQSTCSTSTRTNWSTASSEKRSTLAARDAKTPTSPSIAGSPGATSGKPADRHTRCRNSGEQPTRAAASSRTDRQHRPPWRPSTVDRSPGWPPCRRCAACTCASPTLRQRGC